jgi:hypothetical protein
MTTDTERLDWLERNASKLGIATDCRWTSAEGYVRPEDMREYTDIRSRIDKLAEETGDQRHGTKERCHLQDMPSEVRQHAAP